jgi:hypothetical protein
MRKVSSVWAKSGWKSPSSQPHTWDAGHFGGAALRNGEHLEPSALFRNRSSAPITADGTENKANQTNRPSLIFLCISVVSLFAHVSLRVATANGELWFWSSLLCSAWATCSSDPAWAVIPTNRTHLLPLTARGWMRENGEESSQSGIWG